MRRLWDWSGSRNTILAFLLLFIAASVGFADRNFLSERSIHNILRKVAFDNGFAALGIAFVIMLGHIDLSVGSTLAFSGVVCVMLAGAACGMVVGLMVAKLKISSWIASLSMMLAMRAVVFIMSDQKPISVKSEALINFGKIRILNFDIVIYIYLALILLCMFISRHTRFGTSLYAVGGNEEAARMMGLKVDKVKVMAYMACGLFCAVGGIVLAARLRTAQATAGTSWETFAIASCALGGVKLTGGEGKFSGVLFGSLIIAVLNTMFNYSPQLNTWWQNILMGALVMVSVALQTDAIRLRRRRRTAPAKA